MAAARVAADEEERHPLLPSRGGLEEDSFAMATDGAADFLGAGKGWVTCDVLEHLGELSSAVVHHVPVDTVVVCDLLVVAVPAGEEEHLLVPVLLGIQDVVAAAPQKRENGTDLPVKSMAQTRQQRGKQLGLTIHGKTSWHSWLLLGR